VNPTVAHGVEAPDFFDEVRLLEDAFPEAARVGTAKSVREEVVRFHSSTRLCFPARDVESVRWEALDGERRRCHLTVTFLGLSGTTSPLPPAYLREMLDDEADGGDRRLSGFLDIFNHRIVSLYFRAWKKYRGHLQRDPDASEGTTRLMLALGGQDAALSRTEPGSEEKDELRRLLPMLGPLTRRARSAAAGESGVQVLLGGTPVEVRAWVPRWLRIPERQLCRLGSACSRLGKDLTLGERVRDRSGRCEVRIGPVDLDRFKRLYPGQLLWKRLHRLLRRSLPPALEYQLVVILEEGRAGESTALGDGSGRLGRDTWLGTPGGRDLAVLFPPEVVRADPGRPMDNGVASETAAAFAATEPMEVMRDV